MSIELDRQRQQIQWRLLHSYVIDATLAQDEDNSRGIQIVLGGMRCRDFAQAVADGERARIRPLREDDGTISLRVELLDDRGQWIGLARPPAARLGLSLDEAELALDDWLTRHADYLPPDPEIQP